MRTGVDDELMDRLTQSWKETEGGKKYKLQKLSARKIPSTFYRSDHASFWFPKVSEYKKQLRAMLITDLGPWRTGMDNCYHRPCDDKRWLTDDNLGFIKTTIDAVAGVILKFPPKPLNESFLKTIEIPEYGPPENITEWY
jgi:hypothetical protein